MSDLLHKVLFGTFIEPTAIQIRVHSCLTNCAKHERFESESYANLQTEILRFLRENQGQWFLPTEIKLKIKTRFSVGELGVVLRTLTKEEFLLSQPGFRKRIQLYKFNGVRNDSDHRD